MTLIQC